MNLRKFFSWSFLAIIVLAVIFFSSIVGLLTDWWWFNEVGFTEIFIRSLTIKAAVGFSVGLATLAFLLGNFLLATHTKIPWMSTLPASLFGRPVSVHNGIITKLSILVGFVLSIFSGLIASSYWQDILKFVSSTSFGQKDPIFGKDISFYVFELPVYALALGFVKTILLMTLITCLGIYILRRKFDFGTILKLLGQSTASTTQTHADKQSRLHIGVLGSLLFLTIALSTYFSMFNLLTASGGSVFGATFTDANVMIPLLRISTGMYAVAALLALFYGFSGKLTPLFGVLALTVVTGLASAFVPPIFQKLIVAPNELVKETPYIKNNIAATRDAYGLGNVEEKTIEADKPLTAEDIAANNPTIKNVRLWDRDQLLSTFSQIQEIRTYYEFESVDNDRYTINNESRQIMLSPRELASESLPNKNWINEHLTFTHGYGLAAGPVNQVTPEGLPVLFVKDLPPKTETKELEVTRPEIYYGEITNNWVIVKSSSKEFDYPKGETNVYSTYFGTGGVPTDSFAKRVAFALQFNSLKMLLSSDLSNESRIMYHRNIRERVEKVAPFLSYDNDPYMVIADGKLYWILDAYTLTDRYPYSQQVSLNGQNVNYVRNSVKAVVDAYNGSVTLYQVDSKDPIIKTYAKMFPNTFKPLSRMPKSLLSHIRYPEDIFTLQTAIYTTYHMDDPQNFYNKEDQWEIPAIPQEGEVQGAEVPPMSPRHMIMKLPDQEKEEYILMLPFTPRAKDNLSAWMVARNDGETYGKLVVYSFPKDKLVYGPKQVIGRINQDPEVSRQISLWDQSGSQVIQGPLLVIPIEKSLVYVRPLYLKAKAGKIPELKRVIVAYENKIAMEETLEEGLSRIFGTDDGETTAQEPAKSDQQTELTPATDTDTGLLQQAKAAYTAATNAQRDGDWARYGEEIKKLGEILQKIQE